MSSKFIIVEGDIFLLNTESERAEARQRMRELGIESMPVHAGGPDSDELTGETFEAVAS